MITAQLIREGTSFMLSPLLYVLVKLFIVAIVVAAAIYIIDMLEIQPRYKSIAKMIILVVALIIVVSMLLVLA